MSRAPALLILALLLCAHADARKRRRAPARDPLRVTPSEAIEARVSAEVRFTEAILDDLTEDDLFDSPYVVSAIYYHDGFLARFPEEKPDADPSRRILGHVVRDLTPAVKQRYIALLRETYPPDRAAAVPARFVRPVANLVTGRGSRRRTHRFAIDLFAPEGSPVRSASGGVVMLAESGWNASDPLSTSSREGGNSVIIFDPAAGRFYRYCHLQSAVPEPGETVEAGQVIGYVGHTGMNASRPGHGRHLHFEINEYDGRTVRPLTREELRRLLQRS